MADEKKYIRQLYVNGTPYLVRDEECQADVQKALALTDTLQNNFNRVKNVVDSNFDGQIYNGTIVWNSNYDSKVSGSRIPKLTVTPEGTYNTLEISLL